MTSRIPRRRSHSLTMIATAVINALSGTDEQMRASLHLPMPRKKRWFRRGKNTPLHTPSRCHAASQQKRSNRGFSHLIARYGCVIAASASCKVAWRACICTPFTPTLPLPTYHLHTHTPCLLRPMLPLTLGCSCGWTKAACGETRGFFFFVLVSVWIVG